MKYAVIVMDGAADLPVDELGGLTPLEKAVKPHLDAFTLKGMCGMVKTVPDTLSPGSDVALMSLFGNNPLECYSGRSPIEAAAMGISLKPTEWAFRCNLVTIENGIMKDHSAGNISSEESAELIKELNRALKTNTIRFYSGVSYRNLMIAELEFDGATTPPHDILEKPAAGYLPTGKGSDILKTLIEKSRQILSTHPVNRKRVSEGKGAASSIWFWGQGKMPEIRKFRDKFGIDGAMIAAVDLSRGLGVLMGWTPIIVPGATGYFDTNYKGKGEAAVKALKDYGIVGVHIEAPDEAGHAGECGEKIKAIEQIDLHIIGPIVSYFESQKEPWRILIMPDHPTPCKIRTHTRDPIPFVIGGSGIKTNNCKGFTEKYAAGTGLFVDAGYKLMDMLIINKGN